MYRYSSFCQSKDKRNNSKWNVRFSILELIGNAICGSWLVGWHDWISKLLLNNANDIRRLAAKRIGWLIFSDRIFYLIIFPYSHSERICMLRVFVSVWFIHLKCSANFQSDKEHIEFIQFISTSIGEHVLTSKLFECEMSPIYQMTSNWMSSYA